MMSRKPLGLVALLLLLVIYSFAVMLFAVNFLPDNRWADLAFYPLAGVVWIYPAMKVVKWMQRSDDG